VHGTDVGCALIRCVLQDRRFDADNQFLYLDDGPTSGRGRAGRGGMRGMGRGMGEMIDMVGGWLGDRPLVNGRVQPAIDVARRTCRVRVLNGSSARVYRLAWSDGSPLVVIGTDGGLLERPRTMAMPIGLGALTNSRTRVEPAETTSSSATLVRSNARPSRSHCICLNVSGTRRSGAEANGTQLVGGELRGHLEARPGCIRHAQRHQVSAASAASRCCLLLRLALSADTQRLGWRFGPSGAAP
jgi:hypothetical protein